MQRMRVIADYMYGATPYLGKFAPQDEALKAAINKQGLEQGSIAFKESMSVKYVLQINNIFLAHLFFTCLGLFFLTNAGMPSFASVLTKFWIAFPLLVCFGTGLLIYSITTVLFFLALKAGGRL